MLMGTMLVVFMVCAVLVVGGVMLTVRLVGARATKEVGEPPTVERPAPLG
jgi:hypothetical protein